MISQADWASGQYGGPPRSHVRWRSDARRQKMVTTRRKLWSSG